MANYDRMVLWSDSAEAFKQIMQGFNPSVRYESRDDILDGENPRVIFDSCPVPHEAVVELSAAHPDITFYGNILFEYENFINTYKNSYKNGKCELIDYVCNYFWPCSVDGIPEKEKQELRDKIVKIFNLVDQVSFTKDGDAMSEMYPDEVSVSAEAGDYKMIATKKGEEITDVQIFKKKPSYTWEPFKCEKTSEQDVLF
jgi:hypothetical protein